MNRNYLLIALLLAFIGYAGWIFSDTVTPYVGIAEARESKSNVQVKGLLDKSAPAPHMEGNDFLFVLQDEETLETMPVRYHGMKPDQFDEAYHIVAIGKYRENEFHADKLLIKCPSKYESAKQ
ncbi:MAG: cytochrome c maturation protein CcmE [Selenomonadaceae bacterium]|nr:cytochrome c maturation protein CcmE [Selenomonadaceae bacterium]MBR6342822.1 cytochrome c maturation protein CcmE [Selenomonadaceae bacterium]MBR6710773.1 cytochrome c maturation protein CcmE [Selenomonadaceae bacterium]